MDMLSTGLPDPLSPEDCDLRGYDFMPILGHKLFTSELYLRGTGDEFRTATRLWWAAWNQKPAGSLPSDDASLAMLADYGRDIKAWLKVKGWALHGFVTCSDGRLYHPILSDLAIKAYGKRLRHDAKRKVDLERLKRWRNAKSNPGGNDSGNGGETRFETPTETPMERVREGEGEGEEERKKDSDPGGSAASAACSPRDWLWGEGVGRVRTLTGRSDSSARSLIGRLVKSARDDCGKVAGALLEAEDIRPIDPSAWLTKAAAAPTKADAWAWVDLLDAEITDDHRPVTH